MNFLWFKIKLNNEHDGYGEYPSNFYKLFGRLYCKTHKLKAVVEYKDYMCAYSISCTKCEEEASNQRQKEYDNFIGPRERKLALSTMGDILKNFYNGYKYDR